MPCEVRLQLSSLSQRPDRALAVLHPVAVALDPLHAGADKQGRLAAGGEVKDLSEQDRHLSVKEEHWAAELRAQGWAAQAQSVHHLVQACTASYEALADAAELQVRQ